MKDLKYMKQLMDQGYEILILKHIYDLTEEEMREIIDLHNPEDDE